MQPLLVPSEVADLGEGKPTLRALVRPLSRVDALMFLSVRHVGEALFAVMTGEGLVVIALRVLLSCVLAMRPLMPPLLMSGEGGVLVEGLPTRRAQVGPLTCVDALVCLHIGWVAEAFPTVAAGEGFATAVQKLVLLQVGTQLEALAADVAVKESDVRMGELVPLQCSLLPEALGAGRALEETR